MIYMTGNDERFKCWTASSKKGKISCLFKLWIMAGCTVSISFYIWEGQQSPHDAFSLFCVMSCAEFWATVPNRNALYCFSWNGGVFVRSWLAAALNGPYMLILHYSLVTDHFVCIYIDSVCEPGCLMLFCCHVSSSHWKLEKDIFFFLGSTSCRMWKYHLCSGFWCHAHSQHWLQRFSLPWQSKRNRRAQLRGETLNCVLTRQR